jgi:hypothetical protein
MCLHNLKTIQYCLPCTPKPDNQCVYGNCIKKAYFNFDGEINRLFCKNHCDESMIKISLNHCRYENCNTRSSFNYLNEIIGIYCSIHKKNDMINVVSKTCLENDCNTQPSFNFQNESVGIYCFIHKKNDMVDVINKKCLENDCNTIPLFNYINETIGIYCSIHKKDAMFDVIHKTCLENDCNTIPLFNYINETIGIYCSIHRKDTMVDVVSKRCKTELCDTQVSNTNTNYEGHCLRCFMYLFPDKPVSRNYKTKEKYVADFIKESFPNNEWIFDKSIGNSRRRPDILLKLNTYNIVIEVDENQHKDYDVTCENKRMMQIFQELGNHNIVFIRFNPDDYLDNDKNITSCWGFNKQGICVIKKSKAKEWTQRLNELKKQIEYWLVKIPEKEVEIVQLFYDR